MSEKWTHLISIPSSTSRGTAYGIDVNEDATTLRCRCAAFIHSKEVPKTCKHIEDTRTGKALRDYWKRNGGPALVPRRITPIHRVHSFGPWAHLGAVRATETVVVITERELLQAEAVMREAQRLIQKSPWGYEDLRTALEDLGRP